MSEAVLVALGDLTNGALNYYQTTHVVMAKRKVIETYIEQLQQENQQLKEVIEEVRDMLDLIIPELWNINNAMTYKVKAVRRVLDKVKENK